MKKNTQLRVLTLSVFKTNIKGDGNVVKATKDMFIYGFCMSEFKLLLNWQILSLKHFC